MKKILTTFIFLALLATGHSQPVYKSANSNIEFFAGTAVEDIDAVSSQAISFLNIESGEVAVSIPMTSFKFERSLMQEHFNENYVESDKYPKAELKGKIKDPATINWNSRDTLTMTVHGSLTMHGVTKDRDLVVKVLNTGRTLKAFSTFKVPLADHNIDHPKLLWEKLAEEVIVKVQINYEPYKSLGSR